MRTRGQLLGRVALGTVFACVCSAAASAQTLVFKAELTGASAVPPATTTGMGTAYFIVDLDADTLTYNLTYDQLSSAETGAQIEGFALPGSTGTMQFTLGPGKHKTGVWNYSAADEQSLLDGLAYVVIETSAFPAGELRGQIERIVAHRSFVADLSGAQEVPPVTTTATGTGVFWANTQTNVLNYLITYADLSSAETESHLHGYAAAGATAPVVFDLGLGFHKSGTWTFAQVNENNILADLVYANIHTANNPTGEVRGQLLMTAANPDTYCTAKVNSQLCSPAIAFTGTSTLGGLDNFKITSSNVINQSIAALMWSPVSDNSPFLNGTQCIASAIMAPLVVTATAGNTGPTDCSGVPSYDFTHAQMNSLGLVAGDLVFMQWWYRDNNDPTGFGASDAIVVTILP
ncbi:MAG TPA: CHRD domain-containing protein [Planctomycetota bacterium]|nr:CHRD domain-containing protein [Planctomycetota bacterium]